MFQVISDLIIFILIYKIKSEINEIPFVAIIKGETTDVTNKSKLPNALCYVYKLGKFKSDLLNFRTVEMKCLQLTHVCIKYWLLCMLTANMWISYTCGTAVAAGEHRNYRPLVKENCKQAFFILIYL